MKQYTRIYTGTDGESHFEDVAIPLEYDLEVGGKVIGKCSRNFKPQKMFFIGTDGEQSSPKHGAPQPQFIIVIDGELEIEIGDGSRRLFKAGDILLAEDMNGNGHVTHIRNRKAIVIPLEP